MQTAQLAVSGEVASRHPALSKLGFDDIALNGIASGQAHRAPSVTASRKLSDRDLHQRW